MGKLYLIFFLFFTSSIAHAQIVRLTSFEKRSICEKDKGVWREFGNGCAGNCKGKFDKNVLCTQAITYGCECGRNQCWSGKRCLSMKIYKKIFEAKRERRKEKLAKARKARELEVEENSKEIIREIVEHKREDLANPAIQEKAEDTNLSQFYDITPPPPPEGAQGQGNAQIAKPKKSPQKIDIPPFFIEQQKAKEIAKKIAQGNGEIKLDTLPGLPQIPLPE